MSDVRAATTRRTGRGAHGWMAAALIGFVIAACSGPAGPGSSSGGASHGLAQETSSWSRHDLAPDGPAITALLVGGPGYIAAAGETDKDLTIWTSPDGLAWTKTPAIPGGGRVSAFAAGGPGYIAVGTRGGRASVWTSADGSAWSAVPDRPDFGSAANGGIAGMSAIARGGPGFVAVGVESGGGGTTGQQGAIWTSVDGIAWRRTAVPDAGDWMHDIVAGGPGLVVVGTAQPGAGSQQKAAVWTSTDGSLWARIADGPEFANGAIGAVLNGPKGLVAVGNTIDPQSGALHPTAWASTDGLTWTSIVAGIELPRTGPPQAFEGAAIADLARVADGWIAVGTDIDLRPDGAVQNAAIWSLSDGATWTRLPDEPAFQGGIASGLSFGAGIVAERNGEVIVIGRTAGPRTTVWFSPARPGGTIPAPLPSAPVASGESPSIDATPAPEAPTASEIAVFRSLRCQVDTTFLGAFANGVGERGPDATAFFAALDAHDPTTIAATLPAVRRHLLDAQALLAASVPWPASADWLGAEQKLVAMLLANLDRIERDAAAGRGPANGSSAFLGDAESEYLLAALKALPAFPESSAGEVPC